MTLETDGESQRAPRMQRALKRSENNALPRILDAGHEVVRTMGYYAAGIDDIVRTAGVSRATLYLFFNGKSDLLRALVVDSLDSSRTRPRIPPFVRSDAGISVYREWFEELLEAYDRFGHLWDAWQQEAHTDVTLALLAASQMHRTTRRYATAISETPAAKRSDPEVTAVVMTALIEKITLVTRSLQGNTSRARQVDTLALLMHRGFFGR